MKLHCTCNVNYRETGMCFMLSWRCLLLLVWMIPTTESLDRCNTLVHGIDTTPSSLDRRPDCTMTSTTVWSATFPWHNRKPVDHNPNVGSTVFDGVTNFHTHEKDHYQAYRSRADVSNTMIPSTTTTSNHNQILEVHNGEAISKREVLSSITTKPTRWSLGSNKKKTENKKSYHSDHLRTFKSISRDESFWFGANSTSDIGHGRLRQIRKSDFHHRNRFRCSHAPPTKFKRNNRQLLVNYNVTRKTNRRTYEIGDGTKPMVKSLTTMIVF
jgi:hypothetical protein